MRTSKIFQLHLQQKVKVSRKDFFGSSLLEQFASELESLKESYFSSIFNDLLESMLPTLLRSFILATLHSFQVLKDGVLDEISDGGRGSLELVAACSRALLKHVSENTVQNVPQTRAKIEACLKVAFQNACKDYWGDVLILHKETLAAMLQYGALFEWLNDFFSETCVQKC